LGRMKNSELQLRGIEDPRLAQHATSPLPVWLWSADGARILWANPVGARIFGTADSAVLADKVFDPADPHRCQIARLAGTLLPNGAVRLERLRGFGTPLGLLVTCSCARLEFPDGTPAVLVTALVAPRTAHAAPCAPAPLSAETTPSPVVESVAEPVAGLEATAAEPTSIPCRHPLRFLWQMDADGRFVFGSDEFTRLMGADTAARFGQTFNRTCNRTWEEIASAFGLDPGGHVASAIATRSAWSDITIDWPVDGGKLPVELSGLPVYDSADNFAGYEGFGVCHDFDRISRLDTLRWLELSGTTDEPGKTLTGSDGTTAESTATDSEVKSSPSDWGKQVERPANVVPFRSLNEQKSPTVTPMSALTPIENNAFDELGRQLSERLECEPDDAAVAEPPPEEPVLAAETSVPLDDEASHEEPAWTVQPEPAQSASLPNRELLDLLPTAILIYQLDQLLYANAAFLSRMGFPSLHALEEAGGLDVLYIEPGVSSGADSEAGTPVTIAVGDANDAHAVSPATEARLHAISWDNEPALALICLPLQQAAAAPTAEPAPVPSGAEAVDHAAAVGHFHADDLAAILDTTAEGVLMFDAEGNILACNRSAEALFGHDRGELARQNLATLFAPESRRSVQDYFASIKGQDIASLLDSGREVLGLESRGRAIPLSMTMGRTRCDGSNFFAVFRDLSQSRRSEGEVKQERLTERAANAKADVLARISREVRKPLDSIIGFAEVMIGERALGDERYVEYMKDIRASSQRVSSIINDLLELSRIETGKLNLIFANQNLNDLIENCVTVMQPLANRERTIIRSSLAHALPTVVADANALRQIVMNLIGTSIHLANAGGQVIVSTALTDRGEVALRVRDTGRGLSDKEVAAALEPFRSPSDHASDPAGLRLSLTKALVEANRAQFNIKSAPHSGTLTEVVLQPTLAQA